MTPTLAATFYVSPTGDDAQNGENPRSAWRTLARAARQRLRAGDQLLLQGGAKFSDALVLNGNGEGGDAQNPIVVGSFGMGRALIEAPKSAVEIRSMPGIVVRDLVVRGIKTNGQMARENCGVKILNTLGGARKLAFVRVENVEASGWGDAGISIGTHNADGSKSGFEDVEIRDCVAFDNVYNGILVTGVWDVASPLYANRNVRVKNCRVFRNLGDPLYLENWSGNGLFLEDVDGALVDGCEAFENGALCNAKVGGPIGIWAAVANDVVIQNCHSHHNRTGAGLDGGGFDFDGGVTNSVMQYNLSHDNDGAGYLLYTYPGSPLRFENNVVRFCVSRDDGRKNGYGAISVGHHGNDLGVKGVQIYGNILENSPAPDGEKSPVLRIFTSAEISLENNVLRAHNVPFIEADRTQSAFFERGNVWQGEGETGFVVAEKSVGDLKKLRASTP